MARLVLICLCALVSLQLTLQEPWAIDDSGCITPDNGIGDCMDIYDCEPIIDLLEIHVRRNKVVSERLKSILAKYLCGLGKITKVCCPRVYKTPTIPTPTPTPKPKPITPTPTPTPIIESTPTPPVEIIPETNVPLSGRNLLSMDSCGLFDSENKVADGQRAGLYEFPWMALLAYETQSGIQYLCGGTLINDRYVLTASHCIMDIAGRTLSYVRLGEFDINNITDCDTPPLGDPDCLGPTEDVGIEAKIQHPEFNFTNFRNDIGLIRLDRKVVIKEHITPICLPMTTELQSVPLKNVVIAGWGFTENRTRSDVLLKAEVSIMDQPQCQKIYSRTLTVSEDHICAGGLTRKGSCSGDSGGPIQVLQVLGADVRYVQYGIISLGSSICGDVGLPGVHTKVSNYLDWIISSIRP